MLLIVIRLLLIISIVYGVGRIGAIDFDVGVVEWIFDCFMELHMTIHGLGDGAINSAMEAFGVTEHQYHSAIEIFSSLQLASWLTVAAAATSSSSASNLVYKSVHTSLNCVLCGQDVEH